MTEPFPYDLFLSHSAKDKAVVRPVAERLRKGGLKVWFAEWEIKPGDSISWKNWPRQITALAGGGPSAELE